MENEASRSNRQGYVGGQVTNIVVDVSLSSDTEGSLRKSASEPSIASSKSSSSNSRFGRSSESSNFTGSSFSQDGSNLLRAMSMQRRLPQTVSSSSSSLPQRHPLTPGFAPGVPAKIDAWPSSPEAISSLLESQAVPIAGTYLTPVRPPEAVAAETWLSPGSDPDAHANGECKPCSYYFSVLKPCTFGDSCKKCHLTHERSRRHRPSKSRRESCRRAVQGLDPGQAVQVLSRMTAQTPSLAKSQNNYVSKLLVAKLRGEPELKDVAAALVATAAPGNSSSSGPSNETKVSL